MELQMRSLTLKSMLLMSLIAMSVYGGENGAVSAKIQSRPKFDKKAYLGTVWCHANPWWNLDKSPKNGAGGPDFAWHKFPDDPVLIWKKAADICAPYGLTGLQMEIDQVGGKAGWIDVYKNMLEGFRLAGNDFKGMVFFVPQKQKDDKDNAKMMEAAFGELFQLMKTHPNAYRLDDMPVVCVYRASIFTPVEWHDIIREIESSFGRMIWLADANNRDSAWVESYLQVFDGITIYSNWTLESQRKFVDKVAPLMRDKFPEKIFEFGPHNTYCVHFHFGGISPRLTEKFVKSWEMTLDAKPDAISITNFFDCYENSRILPSYEMDDILIKMIEYELSRWKRVQPPESPRLSLYVANYTNVIIGSDAHFEVIGFPLKAADKKVSIQLEIYDAKGKLLQAFPQEDMLLDAMRIWKYSLPTLAFADCRALVPRLKYTVGGRTETATSYPATNLVTSLRPHLLMWCRSLDNMINVNGGQEWTLNGVHIGETAAYPIGGFAVINGGNATSNGGPLPNQGGGYVRLLRNGREIETFGSWDLKFNRIFRLPDPVASLDWYNIELENGKGGRYLSPAIWVSANSRPGKITLPVLLPDNTIAESRIDAERVPFFYYPCDRNHGSMLIDQSGYDHHGMLGGSGYGGGHLQRTAYRHEHLDGTAGSSMPQNAPEFKTDENGKGFLHFANGSYVIIMGGTAFPYAYTYELSFKPEAFGKTQGLIGTPNGQFNLALTPAGLLSAWRVSCIEGEGGSKPVKKQRAEVLSRQKLEPGKWHRAAVVYDMKKLSLYLDGELQGETASVPDRGHEWINLVTIGSLCAFVWTPVDYFTGGIRDIRIYGRNLCADELLKP